MIAEIGLEILNGLEMEVMRTQVSICYAGDLLGSWKQYHGVLGQMHLNNNLTLRLCSQLFHSSYLLAAKVGSGFPYPSYISCGSGVPSYCSTLSLPLLEDIRRE